MVSDFRGEVGLFEKKIGCLPGYESVTFGDVAGSSGRRLKLPRTGVG
jgi:hypothetical protein